MIGPGSIKKCVRCGNYAAFDTPMALCHFVSKSLNHHFFIAILMISPIVTDTIALIIIRPFWTWLVCLFLLLLIVITIIIITIMVMVFLIIIMSMTMILLIVIMSIMTMAIAGHLDNSPEAREAWSRNKQLSLRLSWLSPGPTFVFFYHFAILRLLCTPLQTWANTPIFLIFPIGIQQCRPGLAVMNCFLNDDEDEDEDDLDK